jgi:predicted transcriptional regulator
MAMTLRLQDEDEQRLERLADRWKVSKQQAVLRAIREADVDVYELSDERAEAYGEALDRLGKV